LILGWAKSHSIGFGEEIVKLCLQGDDASVQAHNVVAKTGATDFEW
jgi:hypothetical protein